MSLLDRVRRYAARHAMWRSETRVVAALSGGSDSVAMLLVLHELHVAGELRLDAVAHLNHQIRPEADEDEAFCRDLAERLNLTFVVSTVDVPANSRANRQSIELAGREARRAFFGTVLRSTGAKVVATAHTEDDQAETVILRLMRGTGARGLGGIAPGALGRIRPVLCATRAELRAELEARGQRWREDATNADVTIPRNRVRHELLPYLETHFNPSARRALARLADVSRAEHTLLERQAVAASAALIIRDGRRVSVDADGFRLLPEAIGRRVLLHALAQGQSRAPSHDDVALLLARMEHLSGKVVLVSRGGERAAQPHAPFSFELPVPGDVQTEAGWVVEAESYDAPQHRDGQADIAQIDAAAVAGGLFVRSRRPGDRIRPVGLGGSKKLQDVLVDRKISRRERDALPIVTDVLGRIVWVAGHVLGEEFRVTERTKGVIILKLRRI